MVLIEGLFRRPTPESVVKEHSAYVLQTLRRVFGPRGDIDDVFQAVFVEIFRSLPSFRGRSQLRTWIHRITLNVAYQEMRIQYRSKSEHSIDDEQEPASEVDLEGEFIDRESLELLYEALESLDPKKRIAIILHAIEDRPLREVSELLGRPQGTVASQVRSGRAELAQFIEGRRRQRSVNRPISGVHEQS